MKAVITGASGFLGRALTERLLNEGNEVAALLRPDSNKQSLHIFPSLQLFHYNTLKDESLIEQLRQWKPDAFIHLGWKGVTGGDRNQPWQFSENIAFTLDAVQLAARAGCKQWIGTGSQAEYGIADDKINEDAVCRPVSAYGKAKLATGIAALGMCELLNLTGAWCRIFSVYGPGDYPGYFIPHIIGSVLKNQSPSLTRCEQQWDYLYINDAVAALIKLAKQNCSGIYNLGSGTVTSLKDVAEQIKNYMGSSLIFNYGAVPYGSNQIMHLQADISKLHSHTGWKPTVPLDKGLKQTIHFYQTIVNESI